MKENQRPVSHIQEMGKITERVVAEQLVQHISENNLITPDQHGATKWHSPTTGIAAIQDYLLQAAENKELAAMLLIDLTAAYELIDHRILDEQLDA